MVTAGFTSGCRYTALKNIYCAGSEFIASVIVNVLEMDEKSLVVLAQCFPP